jgi:RNA polymerase sigma-70 factor (ECF subfamily)
MDQTQADFERLLGELRPRLHRYCARMTGSVIDGEDVLQDAMARAIEAFPRAQPIASPEAWLIRIAHNASLDFLRRRAREEAIMVHDAAEDVADTGTEADRRLATAASLRTLMHLPVAHRCCVILMDVLGYSLQEVGDILDMTLAAVKANLHRGRTRLRELAARPEGRPAPALSAPTLARLQAYIDRFNARDFDALRALLSDEVRIDVVATARLSGRTEAGRYFGNYSQTDGWVCVAGVVEGRPAILVHGLDRPDGPPEYFILLEWDGERVSFVRDFRHARYVVDGADCAQLKARPRR